MNEDMLNFITYITDILKECKNDKISTIKFYNDDYKYMCFIVLNESYKFGISISDFEFKQYSKEIMVMYIRDMIKREIIRKSYEGGVNNEN